MQCLQPASQMELTSRDRILRLIYLLRFPADTRAFKYICFARFINLLTPHLCEGAYSSVDRRAHYVFTIS